MKKYLLLILLHLLSTKGFSQPQCIRDPIATLSFVSSSGGNCTYNITMTVTSTSNGTKAARFGILNSITPVTDVCKNASGVIPCSGSSSSSITDGNSVSYSTQATFLCSAQPSFRIEGTTSNNIFQTVCTPLLTVTFTNPNPVKISYFNGHAEANQIALNWETESETAFSHFVIQRSGNAAEFGDLGTLNSMGESTEKIKYQYHDYNPFPGINYYRLKQVDKDGTVTFSKIIDINADGGASETLVYPNPGTGKFKIKSNETLVSSEVFDLSGKQIEVSLKREGDSYALDFVNKPQSGIYLLKISSSSGVKRHRIAVY
jgi:hypothetical protein